LDKEILQSLVGSDFNWLYDLLQALGRGNIDSFDNAIKQHQEFIARFPVIMKEL